MAAPGWVDGRVLFGPLMLVSLTVDSPSWARTAWLRMLSFFWHLRRFPAVAVCPNDRPSSWAVTKKPSTNGFPPLRPPLSVDELS